MKICKPRVLNDFLKFLLQNNLNFAKEFMIIPKKRISYETNN